MKQQKNSSKGAIGYVIIFALAAVACRLVLALLMNIFERKAEAMNPYVRLVEVTEDTTDPEVWAANWPKQYESYMLTAESTRTRFGGHADMLEDQENTDRLNVPQSGSC
ncbi:MAG: nitrite reductase (cytochrome c-552) [Lentimonas sp.]|jgi:nitrite reductase (cytochrome c-552)